MRKHIVFLLLIVLVACTKAQDKTHFSKKALADVMLDTEGNEFTFAKIINSYKGKKVVIDIWASWCGDCIAGMPRVKELQETYPDAVYLFLSLDKDIASWKKGIKKYKVAGEHYFIPNGWRSDFNKSIDLDWIPRYIVVNPSGEISLFKATKAIDPNLEESIKEKI